LSHDAWCSITIHGHIETVDDLDELVNAVVSNDLSDSYDYSPGATAEREPILAYIAKCLVEGTYPEFSGTTRYANADEVIEACKALGLGYKHSYEGVDGPSDVDVWYAGDENTTSIENDASLEWADLEKLLAGPDPIAAMTAEMERMKRASGALQPPFTASDAVKDHLAVVVARIRVTGEAA
jgi:hypothetical protein